MADHSYLHIAAGAHQGAFGINSRPTPSDAQAKAGNYKLGRIVLHGLKIAIEQPRNSTREGVDAKTGKRWTSRMAAHYGYFSGTRGADGDGVDCFVGAVPQSEQAFIVNQFIGGRFDEHKVMLGFMDADDARRAYLGSYERGWTGLESLIPLSISQLKWWLQSGDMRRPVDSAVLPYEGTGTMDNVRWNNDAKPVGRSLDHVLYDLRRSDSGVGLLFDSVSAADILEDSDGGMTLDAMVLPFSQLDRKINQLYRIMDGASESVNPVAMQITDPFKQRGVANVAAIIELSDGQTISIYFHNPDVTPAKMAATDELISWKWLLNKKDITIAVAPERGADLNPREVARRILKLAEKNSAAFQRANAKRAETMGRIDGLKTEIATLETELSDVQHELEVAKVEAETTPAKAVSDLSYKNVDDMFTAFYPNTKAGEVAWKTIANGDGTGKVLNQHVGSVIKQLRDAGYTVEPIKGEELSDADLLAGLGGEAGSRVSAEESDVFSVGSVKLKAFTKKSVRGARVWGVVVVESGKEINAADGNGSWFKNDTKADMITDLGRMYEATMRGGDPVQNENNWRKSFELPPVESEATPQISPEDKAVNDSIVAIGDALITKGWDRVGGVFGPLYKDVEGVKYKVQSGNAEDGPRSLHLYRIANPEVIEHLYEYGLPGDAENTADSINSAATPQNDMRRRFVALSRQADGTLWGVGSPNYYGVIQDEYGKLADDFMPSEKNRQMATELGAIVKGHGDAYAVQINVNKDKPFRVIKAIYADGRGVGSDWAATADEAYNMVKDAQAINASPAIVGILAVAEAMKKTSQGGAWWSDEGINAAINSGVAQGWLLRPSTSQVEWTQAGIDVVAAAKSEAVTPEPEITAQQRQNAAFIAVFDVLVASHGWNREDGTPGGTFIGSVKKTYDGLGPKGTMVTPNGERRISVRNRQGAELIATLGDTVIVTETVPADGYDAAASASRVNDAVEAFVAAERAKRNPQPQPDPSIDHKEIAMEILQQLGGNKFRAMTGAKDFLAITPSDGYLGGLRFALPSNFAKDGINRVFIRLNAADTYDIEFGWARGPSYKVKSSADDISADSLQEVFTDRTGLDTSLGSIAVEKEESKLPEPTPDPKPGQEDPAKAADRALLQSVVDGSADPLSVDLEALEQAYTRNDGDAEIAALFERAVEVVMAAENNATAGV